ncbi:uncharacterized membrane protein YbhN (UPF0104 family) [Bradyrhizobium sp. USDA 336]
MVTRGFLIFITLVALSVGLLYLALSGIDFAAIRLRLSHIKPLWIALAIAVTIFQIFLGAQRWREISGLCHAPLSNLKGIPLQHDR